MPTNDTLTWEEFVAQLRQDIMTNAPAAHQQEQDVAATEEWGAFVERMRFEIEHDDAELLKLLQDKDSLIEALKAEVNRQGDELTALKLSIYENEKSQKPKEECADASGVYIKQLEAAQQFVNDNTKADVSRLKDLLRKMMPAEYHEEIDKIKEGRPAPSVLQNFGSMTYAPKAEKVIQQNK